MTHMATVGIRSLQQNASAVVARAEAGEVIGVTERGRLVAQLMPVSGRPRTDLLAEAGLLRRATRSLADLPSPLRPIDRTASEILVEMRADER
jgi:prevent-host-death family protein